MSTPTITHVDLLLLGLLQDRPMHGYELHQLVKHEGIDDWLNVSMPGIYYSLGKLRDRALVTESRQRRAGGADKAIYRVTEAGRAAFFDALEEQLSGQSLPRFDYDLGVFFLNRMPMQRALDLLDQRQRFLATRAAEVELKLQETRRQELAAASVAILDHVARYLSVEREWLSDLIESIQGDASLDTDGQRSRLMVLSGDLHDYHLPDLIRLIASGKHSGALTVTDGIVVRTIGFAQGRPIDALCQRRGSEAAGQMHRQEVLNSIYDLFRWQEGRFTFDQSPKSREGCIPLDMSARELILRGCRWVDNWEIIQRLVPSTEAIYELVLRPGQIADLELAPGERRIVEMIDNLHDVSSVARLLGATLFETSRHIYGLVAVGILRAADLDRIRVRRAFREIAELMCHSTFPWRAGPGDHTCEDEVNACCSSLPIRIVDGHIADETLPSMPTDELVTLYTEFLRAQFAVISERFGRDRARQSFGQTITQLVPELQDVADRFGFKRLADL